MNRQSLHPALQWLHTVSFFHAAYEALAVNELRYLQLKQKEYGVELDVPAVVDELERVVVAGHGAGFLAASEAGALLYERRGWRVWRGPLSVLTVDGVRRTPEEDGGVRVLDPAGTWDVEQDLVCEWRSGDVW